MKIDKVCEALKVDRYTVYHLLNSDKLVGYHGYKWEITINDLADYKRRNPTTTPAPLGKDELAVWLKGIR
jgi:hypothetical protein